MLSILRQAIVSTLLLALVLCAAYPLVITGIGQVVFPSQAGGSLITENNKVIGSALIGQNFAKDTYFHSRPSAVNYDASSSGASNFGPTSLLLAERLNNTAKEIKIVYGETTTIPVDMLTASGSGLDPHISPENALFQAPHVAKARNIPSEQVILLVKEHTEGLEWGIWGRERVNVLELNIALDKINTIQ